VIYGSVCSGIEAASLAWEGLGWRAAWFAEIDLFASAVLAYRFPEVRNLGDFTRIKRSCGPIDVLSVGTRIGHVDHVLREVK
jgi:DNA (cytosine-5)-methyltransferase 1